MPEVFRLPDVGEGLTEAEIVAWHVAAGDTVTVNQILVEIETAKAVVELPSPYAGSVDALLVEAGVTVNVGEPIIAIATADSPASPSAADDGAAGSGGAGGSSGVSESAGSTQGAPASQGAAASQAAAASAGGAASAGAAASPGAVGSQGAVASQGAAGAEGGAGSGGGASEGGAKIGEAGVDGRIATLVGYGPRPGSVTRRPRTQRSTTHPSAPVGSAAATSTGSAGAPVSPPGSAGAPASRGSAGVPAPVGSAAAPVPVSPGAAAPGAAAPAAAGSSGAAALAASAPGVTPVSTVTPTPSHDQQAGAGSRAGRGSGSQNGDHGTARVPLAKPPVRKLAKDLGVDLRLLTGSGAGGTITRDDVQTASLAAESAVPEPVEVAADPGAVASPVAGERREPIRGVRKATAAAMVQSAFTAPHVTEFLDVDVTETMALRERLRASKAYADVKLTPLAFVAKAVCLAARRTPSVNASWDERAGEIVYYDRVQLGIAAATPRGLIVPKIRDADTLDVRGLAVALARLTETARSGKTPPADLMGGTITITNVGVFGVDTGTPILNPGEAAILAVGSIKPAPWVVDGELAVRTVCRLALSFDHRLVDGEQGSRFLADIGALLEDPATAMLW